MKKMLSLICLVILICAVGAGNGFAAVSGQCSACHTMHNSQSNISMQVDGDSTPLAALLRGSCLGCHTNTTGSDPLGDAPYVMMVTGGDANCLAGGFFTDSGDATDNNSNNQHDMGSTYDPAGISTENTWYDGTANGLSCGGTNGCHGNQTDLDDMAAIAGGHHNTGMSYRMLYVDTDPVIGNGASDYEEAVIAGGTVLTPGDTVNIYSANQTEASISVFCAKCHSDFHNESGTTMDCGDGSTWIRHPTDVDIPATWEIGGTVYTLTASDYINNPVGYNNADTTGARKVTCLSCHRAHGTANNDLLRWAYTGTEGTQVAGGGATYGCLGCHDSQR